MHCDKHCTPMFGYKSYRHVTYVIIKKTVGNAFCVTQMSICYRLTAQCQVRNSVSVIIPFNKCSSGQPVMQHAGSSVWGQVSCSRVAYFRVSMAVMGYKPTIFWSQRE